jgi:ABC-2 type transport system permease protein
VPVYDRRYRGFDGERRPPRSVVATLARYGLAEVFASRLLLVMFVAACLPFLVFATIVYVAHNLELLTMLEVRDSASLQENLQGTLFFYFMVVQSNLAFVLASFAGPNLVAPDLVHGAMPLYLSRPVRRADYVAGKLAILLVLLSAITWVPGLLLVGLQAALAESSWLASHWRLPMAIFVGSWVSILLLSLFALAISAWIRWRPLATGALFGSLIVAGAFGAAIEETLDTRWGRMLIPTEMLKTIWIELFGPLRMFAGMDRSEDLPVGAAWAGVVALAALALALLHRRIRAFEVVR